jgi:hypothetical protein
MSTAAVFLDIEKSLDTTWHLGLLYKFSDLNFSVSVIKLIGSFSQKFSRLPQVSALSPHVVQLPL